MTKYKLLDELKAWLEALTAKMIYDEDVQRDDTEEVKTAPKIFRMRLPSSRRADKYAPYIIIQFVTGTVIQPEGERTSSKATVRFIFCVHNENEEEGSLELLNLIEAVERDLLADPFFGKGFHLDREAGLEDLIYTDDTRPFYAGEIAATFVIPATERNVNPWLRS